MPRTKANPDAACLPGKWTEQQYQPTSETAPLWLPEPQEKFVHPPGPGKREDGKLWFEGPSRRSIAADKVDMMKYATSRISTEGLPGPRDVRNGDKWLPWHFKSNPETPT